MDYYIISPDGQQAGPYSLDQMRSFWTSGHITLTTLYWTTGMTDWQPVRAIEKLLAAQTPSPTTPVAAQPPKIPKRKGIGCGSGCLILISLFGALLVFVMMMSPDEEPSIPKIEASLDATSLSTAKDSDRQSDKDGYALGYNFGVLYCAVQQAHRVAKDSPDNVEVNGRKAVNSMGLSVNARTEAVIDGYKDGYNEAWADLQKAKAKGLQLNPPSASSTPSVSPSLLTKQGWKTAVPQNSGLVTFGRIACNKQALFDAVGQPSRTQEAGDDEYLYWDCSDGQIQVICARGQYELGLVGGSVNDN